MAVTSAEIRVAPSFRPSGPGQIADSAFEVWRAALVPLTAISIIANVPLFVAIAGTYLWVRDRGWSWGSPGFFVPLAALCLLVAFGAWLRAIGTGAMAHASVIVLSGRTPSTARSLSTAFSLGAAIGLTAALRVTFILGGVLFCGVPGAVALFAFALAPHAVVLERLPASEALVRSARLSMKALGGIFTAVALALAGLLLGFGQILLFARLGETLAGLVIPLAETSLLSRPETMWVALALAKILVDPLVSAASAAAWVDGRIRADGLDLELRSQRIAGEVLSIDPGEPG